MLLTLLIAGRAVQLLVQLLAVRVELLLAHGAGKVVGVEFLLVQVQHLAVNGLLAAGTHVLVPLSLYPILKGRKKEKKKKQVRVGTGGRKRRRERKGTFLLQPLGAGLAKRPAQFLDKGGAGELLPAFVAVEVLRVPLEVQGVDAPAHDVLSTPRTAVAKEDLVIRLAVQLGLILKELSLGEWGQALDTAKAIRVPLLVGGRDHLGQERLTTNSAGFRHDLSGVRMECNCNGGAFGQCNIPSQSGNKSFSLQPGAF